MKKSLLKRLISAWFVLVGKQPIPKVGEWTLKAQIKPDISKLKTDEWCKVTATFSLDLTNDWCVERMSLFSPSGEELGNNFLEGKIKDICLYNGETNDIRFKMKRVSD